MSLYRHDKRANRVSSIPFRFDCLAKTHAFLRSECSTGTLGKRHVAIGQKFFDFDKNFGPRSHFKSLGSYH